MLFELNPFAIVSAKANAVSRWSRRVYFLPGGFFFFKKRITCAKPSHIGLGQWTTSLVLDIYIPKRELALSVFKYHIGQYELQKGTSGTELGGGSKCGR